MLKLSPKQKAFADYRAKGIQAIQAWRLAGFAGNNSAARSSASRLSRSKKVLSYLALCRGEPGVAPDIGDLAECRKLLWAEARGPSGPGKTAALKYIHELEQRELDRAAANAPPDPVDPLVTLTKLSEHSSMGLAIALAVALRENAPWPSPDHPDFAKIATHFRAIEQLYEPLQSSQAARAPTPGATHRQNYFEEANRTKLNGDVHPEPPPARAPRIAITTPAPSEGPSTNDQEIRNRSPR